MHILLSENCFLDYTFYYIWIFGFFYLDYILNETKNISVLQSFNV